MLMLVAEIIEVIVSAFVVCVSDVVVGRVVCDGIPGHLAETKLGCREEKAGKFSPAFVS